MDERLKIRGAAKILAPAETLPLLKDMVARFADQTWETTSYRVTQAGRYLLAELVFADVTWAEADQAMQYLSDRITGELPGGTPVVELVPA